MIRVVRFLPLFVLAMVAFSITAKAESAAPKVRIVDAIDETHLVALKGNTHPAATAKNDVGKVSDALPMSDLILVLSRDTDQQAAFDKFVAGQYDSNSPNFHQWLSPDAVGAQFGPSQTDISTITNWLTGHGLTVNSVSRDRMSIRFSGTAAQVESTFHTEVHNLLVKGVPHVANMSDPQIPAALTTVVVGVKALHNFFPRPEHHLGQLVKKDSKTGGWMRMPATTGTSARGISTTLPTTQATGARPQFGISPTGQGYLVEDVDPWDFATIYNILPLWNASTPINGAGQTIAVAGTSDINQNDIATFRRFFGLPPYTSANQPQIIHPLPSGDDPSVSICTSGSTTAPCGLSDLLENSLDVEWTGAIAPAAQIILVNGIPQSTTDDNLYDAEDYIVQNVDTLNARIINVSYGQCELANGTAGNVEYYDMWQTAAAEGISVFVAAGDSGSASCDDGGGEAAEYGTTVSGLASTPYNTAVGGTDFNWCSLTSATECTPAPYWGTNYQSTGSTEAVTSALGYVPETPWNETCSNPLTLGYMQEFWQAVYGNSGPYYVGFNGDEYGAGDVEESCNAIIENVQVIEEENSDYLFNLVNTVGGSGGASSCVASSTTATTVGACSAGATTTGPTNNPGTLAPQGSLALVNNGWAKPSWQTGVRGIPVDGVRDLPDVSFFASDGFISDSAYLICVSEDSTADPECSYSTNVEPFAQEIGGTSVATPAMAAVMALINQKTGEAQGLASPELYKLAAGQNYGTCSAETIANSPAAANSCYFYDIDSGTNAMPCDATDASPNCNVIHSGDYLGILSGYAATTGYDQATGLGSLNVANVVNAWPQTLGAGNATITVTPTVASLNSSNTLNVTVTLTSNLSGGVTPTGAVTLTASGSTYSQTVTSSTGSYSFTIPANSLPGSAAGMVDTLTANYAGDSVYAATSNTGSVTVTTLALLTPTITVTPASATLNSSASLSVVVTVAGTSITPTGTVTLSGGGYTSPSETLTAGTYTFTIPANSLATGADQLTVNYGGDGSYAAGSNTATVTVTESTFTLNVPVVAVTPATIAPGASASAVVTVAATSGYTGSVTLTCQQTGGPSTGDGTSCTLAGGAGVTLTSGTTSGTVTFTVATAAPVAAVTYPQIRKNGWAGAGTGAVLAVLMLIGIPARRRSWRQMLGVLVLMTALGGLAGCGGSSTNGGGGQTDPGTAAGTYTYTVQATGNPSVTPAVSTTFNVVVN
jgi:hypothetical protein